MSEAPPVAEEASEFRRCAPSGATDRERTAAGARVPERADEKKICAWNEARFLKFWAFYRDTFCASDHSRAGGKLKAADAWDKLKPDDAMIWEMADYLRATMNTRQWKDGIGMAMASTFLNGIRLHKIDLDERPEAAPTETRRSAPVREEDEFL